MLEVVITLAILMILVSTMGYIAADNWSIWQRVTGINQVQEDLQFAINFMGQKVREADNVIITVDNSAVPPEKNLAIYKQINTVEHVYNFRIMGSKLELSVDGRVYQKMLSDGVQLESSSDFSSSGINTVDIKLLGSQNGQVIRAQTSVAPRVSGFK